MPKKQKLKHMVINSVRGRIRNWKNYFTTLSQDNDNYRIWKLNVHNDDGTLESSTIQYQYTLKGEADPTATNQEIAKDLQTRNLLLKQANTAPLTDSLPTLKGGGSLGLVPELSEEGIRTLTGETQDEETKSSYNKLTKEGFSGGQTVKPTLKSGVAESPRLTYQIQGGASPTNAQAKQYSMQ